MVHMKASLHELLKGFNEMVQWKVKAFIAAIVFTWKPVDVLWVNI